MVCVWQSLQSLLKQRLTLSGVLSLCSMSLHSSADCTQILTSTTSLCSKNCRVLFSTSCLKTTSMATIRLPFSSTSDTSGFLNKPLSNLSLNCFSISTDFAPLSKLPLNVLPQSVQVHEIGNSRCSSIWRWSILKISCFA